MPFNSTELYKQICNEHHRACDERLKMFQGWCISLAAFAAAFVWIQKSAKPLSWIVPALAAVCTLLMLFADRRSRSAIRAAKQVGEEIERDPLSGIPVDQRFFCRLSAPPRLTHSWVIDICAWMTVGLLLMATVYLVAYGGGLPQ